MIEKVRAQVRIQIWIALAALLSVQAVPAKAAISMRDDAGDLVTLAQPARRVISLSPHVTEMLFAAGGADRIVGTVNYSDYPPAAKNIPRVGDNRSVDIEHLLSLKPDLLVVWRHNASSRQMDQLRRLGIPLFYSDPHKLEDIPESVLRLGRLMGTEQQAQQSAGELRKQLETLVSAYRNRPRVRVFYQVWDKPLYTLNERHIITDAIRVCGGENIFASLPMAAPSITQEAVVKENPEVIVSGDRNDQTVSGIEIWKQYPSMLAVKRGNLFAIDGNLINRSGPRIIDGAGELCARLEQARGRRGDRP
ncbi:cobalamin-binding protein [Noviherbaspirillum sp. Root189]|uniref:cobalamin-binding protein n=1 Tax=Noviherbaspirillum sp. Root189 TaxID=1736487 RepID=UPI00070A2643|nr:cobalamin-binding protein [Noviherbaspirillum sp. Root189]KRB89015.1 cobalamin-binding protein [Noviherbaspirillum sp. Root189]